MAIQHLTDEQIRTWSIEQKDRWWLANVFRGDMPQLTFRSAATGFLLGAILSATNLYIGAKTGWSLGVGLTSVILAFAAFRLLSRLGMRDMTILENNASQSVATAAGYMTGPLISGMAAYMWVTDTKMPWEQMLGFNIVLSILGVLVAFPLKRRFINDEQQPFPEGRAAGVVLDTLYTSDARHGMFQAKVLAIAAGFAGIVKFLQGESYQVLIQGRLLGRETAYWFAENVGVWWEKITGYKYAPHSFGFNLAQIEVRGAFDLSMIGAGGLMGVRPGLNMVLGMLINYVILVPLMISWNEIKPHHLTAAGDPVFTRSWVLNSWALWWGVAILVTSSVTSLFAKPQIIMSAFRIFGKKDAAPRADVLKDIEFPLWISIVGIPIVGAVGVWMCHAWFGVDIWIAAVAIPLIILLTLIAVNSTALTSITPTGSLSKIPQFTFGLLKPKHAATNLMTATMCTEVASNASNLLMDIKPGYMLGAKPRQQAIGHIIGIFSGGIASTMLFYYLFLPNFDPAAGKKIEEVMSAKFAFPGAVQWKGISDLLNGGFDKLPHTAVVSMAIAAAVGIVFEIIRIKSRNKFPLSPLAIGLGVVIPPESTVAMCFGAVFFWTMGKLFARPEDRAGQGEGGGGAEHGRVEGQLGGAAPGRSLGHRLWVGAQEPICAGLIAGAALVGIGDLLIGNFVLE